MLLPSFLEVRDAGGTKGRGVFALNAIPSGTVVLSAAQPVVFVPREDPTCPGAASASREDQNTALKSLYLLSSGTASERKAPPKHAALRPTPCARCLAPINHETLRHASENQAHATQSADANFSRRSRTALRCSKCKCTYYCSTACQRAAWAQHKTECEIFKGKRVGRISTLSATFASTATWPFWVLFLVGSA